jgi:hypothetical protein
VVSIDPSLVCGERALRAWYQKSFAVNIARKQTHGSRLSHGQYDVKLLLVTGRLGNETMLRHRKGRRCCDAFKTPLGRERCIVIVHE